MGIIDETKKHFLGTILDLKNFDKEITEINVFEELEYFLYMCDSDGIDYHLEGNLQKYKKLKELVLRYSYLKEENKK